MFDIALFTDVTWVELRVERILYMSMVLSMTLQPLKSNLGDLSWLKMQHRVKLLVSRKQTVVIHLILINSIISRMTQKWHFSYY